MQKDVKKNQIMIGLEIHGYLSTKEKLFCNCKAIHGAKNAEPNTYICPICTSQPGAKPMLPNSEAVKKIIQIALILNCKINDKLIWQRKHYDWPDLPKGYQNTLSGTYATPVGIRGTFQSIRIREAHLEEDPAAWNPLTGEVDYNRSGSPLVEIVTDPDFKDSEQVVEWLKQLLHTLSYINAIDKDSGIKADVNVSINNGERIEIKNINSLTSIKNAIDIEIIRQEKEPPLTQETRRYDEAKNITVKMRSKEQAEDYRFISDPDLPILKIENKRVKEIKSNLPETPQEKLKKLIKKHKIDKNPAEILTKRIDIAEFFEKVIEQIPKEIAVPWTTIELLRVLNYNKKEFDEVEIQPSHFIELLKLIKQEKITELKAKEILNQFIPKSFSPSKQAEKNKKISAVDKIGKICKDILSANKQAVSDFKSGKKESLNFLIGQVMKETQKRADYQVVRKILEKMMK
ncbi:MAG: Asp-tRNA(Asn)/Glu-tRNA(Gln) amidotransferase subunit GatB [Nanoarchaeota archaeon]|nr:Asp-tRNA(Asn)/Glu-tRNA(Gln) amidotransferase subunit GatB [Nanoarchaeota archaeon]